MIVRTLAICLLALLVAGSTNSSRSSYVLTFSAPTASEQLVAAAKAAFQERGFAPASDNELQYGRAAIWVSVHSPSAGELRLVFTQLRGGCGDYPEVAGAAEAVAGVRSTLESQFGPSQLSEAHRANARSSPK